MTIVVHSALPKQFRTRETKAVIGTCSSSEFLDSGGKQAGRRFKILLRAPLKTNGRFVFDLPR